MQAGSAADRIRAVLELTALGEQMLRARLRRENPAITGAEVEAAVDRWYTIRPGAPFGDAPGTPSARRL